LSKQASDYETTAEYLLNYIQEKYEYGEDITKSLYHLQTVDLSPFKPKLQRSNATDIEERNLEDEEFKMEFKIEMEEYRDRVTTFEKNKPKVFSFLLNHCSKGLKDKIQARSNYENEIKDNPIELLKAIKQHALNFQEQRYDMAIMYDAFTTLFTTKQKEDESLQEYTKRFRVAKEVLESHIGGPIVFTKIISSMSIEQEKATKETYNRYMAYVYMCNADQNKYGSIMKGLNTQKSLGNNQYPKTITEANNVFSNHRFDNVKQNQKKTEQSKEENPRMTFNQSELI